MRYMMIISAAEKQDCGPFPKVLMDEIVKNAAEHTAKKQLLGSGGLLGSDKGTRVRVDKGRVTVTDGPYTEAKEVVGGFAMFEFATREEAIENARAFMQLHVKYWPGWQGTCDVRPMMPEPH